MASQPADDALARLVDKNSKLYGQLEVQRERIHELESRATGAAPSESVSELPDPKDARLVTQASPFLAWLARHCAKSGQLQAHDLETGELSEVEATVRRRSLSTSASAAVVAESVEKLKRGPTEAAEKNDESAAAALATLLRAENGRLRDVVFKETVQLRQAESSLADREAEVLVLRRKLAQERTSQQTPERTASVGTLGKQDGQMESEGTSILQQQLDELAKQMKEKEEALKQAHRDARGLQDALVSEREAAARARDYDTRRLHGLSEEFAALEGALHAAHAERDHVLRRLHEAEAAMDEAGHLRRRLGAAGEDLASLERRLEGATAAVAAGEDALAAERAKHARQPLVEELQKLAEAYKRDAEACKASLAKQKEQLNAANWLREAAESALQDADRQRQEAVKELTLEHVKRENAFKAREADLKLFMEMVIEFGGDVHQHVQQHVELEQQRTESLRAEIALLREQLASKYHSDGAQLSQTEKKPSDAAALQEESEALLQELESVGAAYEEAQAQSARTMAALTVADEERARLMLELSRARREGAEASENARRAGEEVAKAHEATRLETQRALDQERRAGRLVEETAALRTELTSTLSRLAAGDRVLRERAAELDAAARELEAMREELRRRAAERDAALERAEEAEKKAAEQTIVHGTHNNGHAAQGASGTGGSDLELAALRKMINCSVCHARQKSVIITKCYHMFCGQCIKRNLESRHRKCPGCGISFGQNDVRQFFFT